MPNTNDFIGAVYDELAKLVNITDSNPSFVMQMAWPGFSLSPQDFKPADQPGGPYDPQIAKETFSHLANIAPALNRTFFQNSGLEVDDLYEILVSGAIPAGSTSDNVASNPVYKLFGDAQYEFLQARTGSSTDPNAFYYPCLATPVNWYDEAAAAFWPTLSMQSSDIKPAAPGSLFVKAGGLARLGQGVWKLRPSSAASATTIKQNAQQLVIKSLQVPVTKTTKPLRVVTKPLSAQAMAAVRAMPAGSRGATTPHANSALTRTPAFSTQLAAVKLQTLFAQKNVPLNSCNRYNLGKQIQALDLTRKTLDLGRVDVSNRYQLINVINQALPTKPAGSSDGFSISFKYCRVNIDRSWFKLALLKMKNWYMFGTQAGEYSNGSSSDNPGMFPLLPTSFIAIRDLKITANWSAEDRQNLGQASALGFFDIRDSTLNANTLEVKGLQVLGWISSLLPQLPPMSSP
ncbi:hypothetical protein DIC66_15405 [Rhodoferax lacus]|uniref:Uncharacterized protein n=2 Tax=Rhodoferax lacus TaxID=2184758 RepID=A0A3E1RA49_9BURK|nr:hypothetical protein DIC66_15405 [Rhodoferax lacus]